MQLRVPKLRHIPFETAIIERYRRMESSVEEALVEIYLAGVSVRKVEDITEAHWGVVSPSTISDLNQKIFARVEAWGNRAEYEYPFVFMDGIWLKRAWGGEVETVSGLVAIGVNQECYREVLGVAVGSREDLESWRGIFAVYEGPGAGAYPASGPGQEPESPGSPVRILSRRPLAALHGPFLPERAASDASGQDQRSEPFAQGHPLLGRPGVGAPKSGGDGEQAERVATDVQPALSLKVARRP